MAQRNVIEETFRVIAPKRKAAPAPPVLAPSFNTAGGDLGNSLAHVSQEIVQLRAAWQQQFDLIAAHSSAKSKESAGSGGVLGGHNLLSGPLSMLSPIARGLLGLFGGHGKSAAPDPLPVYVPPPPISISGVVHGAGTAGSGSAAQPYAPAAAAAQAQQSAAAQQITVNISAMDSQSFLDRSNDIASAVRLAMLNLHPINDVVADL